VAFIFSLGTREAIIPALRRLRKEDSKFKASLGDIVDPFLSKQTTRLR
jgi:hypothetical protein